MKHAMRNFYIYPTKNAYNFKRAGILVVMFHLNKKPCYEKMDYVVTHYLFVASLSAEARENGNFLGVFT